MVYQQRVELGHGEGEGGGNVKNVKRERETEKGEKSTFT